MRGPEGPPPTPPPKARPFKVEARYRAMSFGWRVTKGDQDVDFVSLADLGRWARERDVKLLREEETP